MRHRPQFVFLISAQCDKPALRLHVQQYLPQRRVGDILRPRQRRRLTRDARQLLELRGGQRHRLLGLDPFAVRWFGAIRGQEFQRDDIGMARIIDKLQHVITGAQHIARCE